MPLDNLICSELDGSDQIFESYSFREGYYQYIQSYSLFKIYVDSLYVDTHPNIFMGISLF